jgi:exodeoxyribonuclease V alpha subunit
MRVRLTAIMDLFSSKYPANSSSFSQDHKLAGENLQAEVQRITFRNEENGWTVLKVLNAEDQNIITVTGTLPPIQEGEHLQLIGTWSSHTTYGRQFKAERAVPTRPSTRAAILRYLSSGIIKGIGEKTAARIVDHFGLDTFKIIDENPGCLLQVPKLGKKKTSEIIESWRAHKSVSDVMMFLNNHGISLAYSQRIIRLYGEQAIELISANPYQLAVDISGIGFIKADNIAKSIGIAPDSPERIRAAIIYQMQQSEDRGHCYQTLEQLKDQLLSTLGLSKEKINQVVPAQLMALCEAGSLLTEVVGDKKEQTAFWRPELLSAEHDIARKLAQLMCHPVKIDSSRVEQWIEKYNVASPTTLSEAQSQAVRKVAASKVFILTGGPGVGKTTTANAIIRLFKAMGKSVLLAAPTGRAAQRLSEISAEPAKTIHRLLEWQPAEAGFSRNELNPLKADVIICDEASMLDTRLAASLVSAVSQHSQLVFIGDVDQLPSVGPGNVLRDMINSSKIPFVRLSEIFRQASASNIVRYAHDINHGITPIFIKDTPTDCQFLEVDSSDEIKEVMLRLLTDVLPTKYNFNPVRDVQVLSPMNRGDLGTFNINAELQKVLNPDPREHIREANQRAKEGELRNGDKVIQTSNNYDLQVFNGDIGFVLASNVEGGKTKIIFGEDRVITYDRDQVSDLKLAYAITIHKSQGSEFPVTIIPMSMQHYVMLQRNLIYTGLTRARKLAIFIGSKKALQFAVNNNISVSRQTNLAGRLNQDINQ